MSARLTATDKRQFAQDQFDELCRRGLSRRLAGDLMRVTGPRLAIETVQFAQHCWDVVAQFENDMNQFRKIDPEFEDDFAEGDWLTVDACEIRAETLKLFFDHGGYSIPLPRKKIVANLQMVTFKEVGSLEGRGLKLPVTDRDGVERILRGMALLLPKMPFNR